jgi:putative photosynthetic complex assembly protein 2
MLDALPDPLAATFITIFAWWFSTGLILILVRLPKKIETPALIGFGGVALAALAISWVVSTNETPLGAYIGFFCGLVVWGWHEAAFLTGKIMGPRPLPCPPGAQGYARFKAATNTILHHEVALFATLLMMLALTWNGPNQMAAWTFLLLFVMRLSAKFNMFLGVPNISHEFFPPHLAHIKTYLPQRNLNPLMPVSLIAIFMLACWLMFEAGRALPTSGTQTGLTILSVLSGLALLEHIFMIARLGDTALWRWAVPRSNIVTKPDPLTPREIENQNNV